MNIQYILELIGTFTFAISGALAVQGKSEDWFGAGFTGFVTAIGGGTLRDVLLGSYPLTWITDIYIIYTILVAILIAGFFNKVLQKLRRTLSIFDTLGIALFTVAGVEKALSLGVRWEIAAIMGMFSAVFGGVIRDTLINETPVLFRKEIYASACLAGGLFYVMLNSFDIPRDWNFICSASFIVTLRVFAVKYHINFPQI
ncbi:trimeric intracellular cation channel family protein [Marivirga sp. S37H4]|uniref:Trimeric intracellular cation channel family protein n=1 Tax=Marivirga aurantiaca TaxID=2802615 RepID=A0A934X2A6_9BACT|nr:trimeric intracellular cation channel family protein [Marivirga aurantiaca]MBK6267156.1 trimeric intracellular cation channel family protein [Marivirga aurantiaca]